MNVIEMGATTKEEKEKNALYIKGVSARGRRAGCAGGGGVRTLVDTAVPGGGDVGDDNDDDDSGDSGYGAGGGSAGITGDSSDGEVMLGSSIDRPYWAAIGKDLLTLCALPLS